MELRNYMEMFRRWAWLLILGLVLGAVAGLVVSLYQTPVYQASTRVLAVRASQSTSSDLTYLSDQQLAQTYVQLLTTKPVLEGASTQLCYPINLDQLTVQPVGTTQVIKLSVEDTDPQRSAAIANALVLSLIDQNENLQAGRYAITEESLQVQINQTQAQIVTLQTQVNQVSTETVEEQLSAIRAQIDPLQAEVSDLQKEIASLMPSTAVSNRVKVAADQARLAEIEPILTLYQQIYSNLLVLGQPSEAVNTDSVRLAQTEEEKAYAGHAVWNYVAETHGSSIIPNIIYITRVTKNIERGFYSLLNMDFVKLNKNYIAFYRSRYVEEYKNQTEPEGDKQDYKIKKESVYYDVKISPDGLKIAYGENTLGRYRVKVLDTETGKTDKIFAAEPKMERIQDYSYPVLGWHPSGEALTFFAESKGALYMYIYTFDDKSLVEKEMKELDKILDFAYSKDGKKMVFSGVVRGQSDLYLMDLSSQVRKQLSYDIYDDLYPQFTDNSSRVIFASNITRVLIDTRNSTSRWCTVGAGTNIIEASWRALADSMEYGLMVAH